MSEAARQLREAAAARKCWPCGCLRHSLEAIGKGVRADARSADLAEAMTEAAARLEPERYDCLGCDVCFPALAVNALNREGFAIEADACAAAPAAARDGWPPLPGSYRALRFNAPVAVCALTSDALATGIARSAGPEVAIVGTMQTENLGVERLVRNLVANPHIRTLVLCGEDSRGAVGHLPGQCLVALAQEGVDGGLRVVGAHGRRPVLKNITRDAVEHFRRTVRIVDRRGETDAAAVLEAVRTGARGCPAPAAPFAGEIAIPRIEGRVPAHMTPDPAGYFVVYVDRARGRLSLEHFTNDGLLDAVIDGRDAASVYSPAVERGFVSRLEHAAYLGRELARAERALRTDEEYVQDAAPEAPAACCCGPGDRCGDAARAGQAAGTSSDRSP